PILGQEWFQCMEPGPVQVAVPVLVAKFAVLLSQASQGLVVAVIGIIANFLQDLPRPLAAEQSHHIQTAREATDWASVRHDVSEHPLAPWLTHCWPDQLAHHVRIGDKALAHETEALGLVQRFQQSTWRGILWRTLPAGAAENSGRIESGQLTLEGSELLIVR